MFWILCEFIFILTREDDGIVFLFTVYKIMQNIWRVLTVLLFLLKKYIQIY